jgi:hypothetical protein
MEVAMAQKRSEFANQADISDGDTSRTGRENNQGRAKAGSVPADEVAPHPPGGQPRSGITGRHDEGSGANETIDGLNATEESLRQGAEETPIGAADKPLDEVPVFDRGDLPPKV